MCELNARIAVWRETLSARLSAAELNELEDHLREALASLPDDSLSPDERFLAATRRMGAPAALAEEFAKARPARFGWKRASWILAAAVPVLAMFVFETIQRHRIPTLDAKSGRFLVRVRTFRGPSARSEANALASELRHRHGFPAYIVASGDLPRRQPSPQRGRVRPGPATEQVAVLVGDCETREDCVARCEQVRRIMWEPVTFPVRLIPFQMANPYLPQSTAFGQKRSRQE
jgi:hypothetical protein